MAVFEGRSNLSRLRSPVLERVSERMVSLLADPKLGWDRIADAGHRANVEFNRQRLQNALTAFEAAENESLPEKDALLLSLGNFDRDYKEKGIRLRRRLRCLEGPLRRSRLPPRSGRPGLPASIHHKVGKSAASATRDSGYGRGRRPLEGP